MSSPKPKPMNFVNPAPVEGTPTAAWKATGPFAVANLPSSEILSPDASTNVKATTIAPATKDAKTSSAGTLVSMLAELMLHAKLPITELFAHVQKIILETLTQSASQNVLHMLIVLQTGRVSD